MTKHRAQHKAFSQRVRICRFCGQWFAPIGRQDVCYALKCRQALKREWIEKDKAKKREKTRQRQILQAAAHPRDRRGRFIDLPEFRPCLKCDQPIKEGHLCPGCRKDNQEFYWGVW